MTYEQASHMFAAALFSHPQGDLGALHERLRGRLNTFPVKARSVALDVARPLFRLTEYYEARNGELPLLADVLDRGDRGQSVDAALARLDTYWERVCFYLRSLGENHDHVFVPHDPNAEWPTPMETPDDS